MLYQLYADSNLVLALVLAVNKRIVQTIKSQ